MRRHLRTFLIAAGLAAGTFAVAPVAHKPPPGPASPDCLEWLRVYGSVVPPDLWGVTAGAPAEQLSTTSEMDPRAVDQVLAAQPEGCPPPEPPPGAGGGGWLRD